MATELTAAALDTVKAPATGRIELQDTLVPELSLRITASDQRTWTVRARLPDGRRIRPTIGRYSPKFGLREARREARKVLGDIAKGIDPTAAKREAAKVRGEAKEAQTVATRLAEWQADKAKGWSERYCIELARVVDKVIVPKLGRRVLAETTREDWTGLATAVARRNKPLVGASWLYDAVSSFLNYAEARGWIDHNPLPRRGRNHLVPRPKARERVLTDGELVRIWQASAGLTPKSRTFARLLMLTAARVNEAANIAVGEVSMLTGRWMPPGERVKNRNPITIPLHPLLLTELRAIWPEGNVAAGFKLLGAIRGSGLQAPSKIKARLDQLSGVKGWRWHDLRRTARTGMARLGIGDRAAEAALNHVSDRSALVRVYDRHDYAAEAWTALEAWQARAAAIFDGAARRSSTIACDPIAPVVVC